MRWLKKLWLFEIEIVGLKIDMPFVVCCTIVTLVFWLWSGRWIALVQAPVAFLFGYMVVEYFF